MSIILLERQLILKDKNSYNVLYDYFYDYCTEAF